MATTTVPMDDRELMQDAMAEAPAQEQPQAQAEAPAPEQKSEAEHQRERDDKGRFVAKTETEQPQQVEQPVQQQATEEPKDDQTGQVPAWRLRELREARDAADRRANEESQQRYAAQQQMAELQRRLDQLSQPKQEPVDFYANPDEAFQQRFAPIQTDIQKFKTDMRIEFGRELAVVKYGEQTVAEAEAAIAKAMQTNHPEMPGLSARMNASRNPVDVVVKWHQQSKLLETTGGDLEAYRQKLLDEALKDPAYQAKVLEAARLSAGQQQGSRPNVQIPPSLNKATGAGGNPTTSEPNDMSDANLYAYATARGGR